MSISSLSSKFYPAVSEYIESRSVEFDEIDDDRKRVLHELAEYIAAKVALSQPIKLTFICTHNSRRSHLSQIWAQIAGDVYGIPNLKTYSGGTEATAFNPRAVAALQRCGLKIEAPDVSIANPRYEVRASEHLPAQVCFSKVFNETPNPTSGYCAVMTCSQADDACPLVMGCELRIPIRYEDPKIADDTPRESELYDERSRQICREMLFVMSCVAK